MNIGDVVRLRSGGPLMTITEITDADGKELLTCSYYSDKAIYNGRLYRNAVVLIDSYEEGCGVVDECNIRNRERGGQGLETSSVVGKNGSQQQCRCCG